MDFHSDSMDRSAMNRFDYMERTLGSKSCRASLIQDQLYQQMVENSEFCDVTLEMGNIVCKAHWSVLVSCPFFQSLYNSGLSEKRAGKVVLQHGNALAMRSALKFLYLGSVEISFSSVPDLLECAEYLQIDDLKQYCADYLRCVDITLDNCIQLCLLSSLYDLDLYNDMFQFLCGHLPEVLVQDDLLKLTSDSIQILISDPTLCYVSREDFFHFIVRWTEHDTDTREKYFARLFCALDLQKVSRNCLEEVIEKHELISKFDECKVHVLNVKMKYMTGLLKEDVGLKDVILVAGGMGCTGSIVPLAGLFLPHQFDSPMTSSCLFAYVPSEDRWTELAPLPCSMKIPIITYDGQNTIYVVDISHSGSCDEENYIFKYDIECKTWTNIRVIYPDVYTRVSVQGMMCCQERLFIVASGYVPQSQQSGLVWNTFLVEVNQQGDVVSPVKCTFFQRNVNTQIVCCSAADTFICVLGNKVGMNKKAKALKFFYYNVISGRKMERNRDCKFASLLCDVEGNVLATRLGKYTARVFGTDERTWKVDNYYNIPLPPDFAGRTDFSYVCHNNSLYVIGGKSCDKKQLLVSSFRFEFDKSQWVSIADLPSAHMNSGICVVTLPSEHVKCHVKCPHCTFNSRRSSTKYRVDNMVDSEDDDADHYISDDYDIYSDPWDVDRYVDDYADEFDYWY